MIITLSPIRLNTKKAQTQNWTHQSTKINSAGGNEGSERTFQASRSNQSEARSAKRRRGLDPIGRWAVAIATGEPPRTPAPRLARAAVNSALITSQDLNVRNLLTRTFEIWHSVETRKRRFVLCIFLAFHPRVFQVGFCGLAMIFVVLYERFLCYGYDTLIWFELSSVKIDFRFDSMISKKFEIFRLYRRKRLNKNSMILIFK